MQQQYVVGRRKAAANVAATGAATLAATAVLWVGPMALGGGHGFPPPTKLPSIALAVHLATVLPAVPLGAYVLWGRKGDARHRLLGRIWAMLMVVTALSSFGLRGLTGQFSLIHLLSLLTLVAIPRAIWQARRGNIKAHRRTMRNVYIGLLVAGLFAFLPGRILGTALFG